MNKALIRQLFFFGIAGTIGFIVDAGVLYSALYAGLGYYSGRIISYICAATVTWYCNRRWAFKSSSGGNKKAEWGRFLVFNLIGFAVNYGAYLLALNWLHNSTIPSDFIPLLAVAAGSAAGLLVNFTINKYLVFRP